MLAKARHGITILDLNSSYNEDCQLHGEISTRYWQAYDTIR